ncbi:MAG: hypothetical protein HY534_05305 [Chloroflexi bacterium]|nr:hypothetical protein [Chloroflexota bacterium]
MAAATLPEGTYTAQAEQTDAAGNTGASSANTFYTPIGAPASLSGTSVSSTQNDLSWTSNSTTETGLSVERCSGSGCSSFAQVATVSAGVTTYSDAIPGEGTYRYRVAAFNSGNGVTSDYSNEVAVASVPTAPSGLLTVLMSTSRIDLSWTDASGGESDFHVERCTGSGCTSFAEIAAVGADVTTYSSTGLTEDTWYRYRVRAHVHDDGLDLYSSYSNVAQNLTTLFIPEVTVGFDPVGRGITVSAWNPITEASLDALTPASIQSLPRKEQLWAYTTSGPGGTMTMELRVWSSTSTVTAKIASLTYAGGTPLTPAANNVSYQWTLRNGALNTVAGQAWATRYNWNAARNQTVIQGSSRVTATGLVTGHLATNRGSISVVNTNVVSLSVNDVSAPEGDSGTTNLNFTVSLQGTTMLPVTVNYATTNGSASAGSDYTAVSGMLAFGAGETSKTVAVVIVGDSQIEASETLYLNLSGATNAIISDAQGKGTITNDEVPTVSINDVTLNERHKGLVAFTFTASLSAASLETAKVSYATADVSAVSNRSCSKTVDYVKAQGTLSFSPGQTSKTLTVKVCGNTINESDETFVVNLSNPSGAIIADSQGLGTILNDD